MPSHTIYIDDGKYDYIKTFTLSGCTVSIITEGLGSNAHPLKNYDFANEAQALEFYEAAIRRDDLSYQPPTELFSTQIEAQIEEEEQEFTPRIFDFDLQEENLETDELVKRLAVVSNGLEIYESESSDYPFKPFVWKLGEKGGLTINKLLLAEGFMELVTWNDFLNSVISNSSNINSYLALAANLDHEEILEKCQILETTLQTYCKNINVYKIIHFDPMLRDQNQDHMNEFYIIFAETHKGNWLGIAPKIGATDDMRTDTYRVEIPTDLISMDNSSQILMNTLENVLTGLEFATTQDITTREFYVTYANSQEQLIYQLLDAIDFIITCSFAPFGSVAEYEDQEFFQNIHPLDQLLQLNLTNLQEYVIGTYSLFHIYAIGNTQNGDYVGVSTVAVWT